LKSQPAKQFLRRLAIRLCDGLLRRGSRPYVVPEAVTVVIAPHPDDETLACGGLIARKRHEGLPVHVIFITDGSASHPNHARLNSAAIAELRRGETMRAMTCLGVERTAVHFLEEPDGTLKAIDPTRRENLVQRLAALLATLGPGEIFLPCNPDGSSEHDAVFGFTVDALARTGLAATVWQYPIWCWWNPSLLLRHWVSARDLRRLPLEDYQRAKRRAIHCYQSQINPLAPDPEPALPPGLVDVFLTDTEFFFRYEPARKKP
jgi:LmbE family N-acetylglucosaminyl deacetylase